MAKETLTREGIQYDLKILAEWKLARTSNGRLVMAIPFTILAIFIAAFFQFNWLPLLASLLILLFPAYHYIRFFGELKSYTAQKKRILEAINRSDFSISVQKFSHLSNEIIYDPHRTGTLAHRHVNMTSEITSLCFEGGASWKLPPFERHYAWSREFYTSTAGMKNLAVEGNEYYVVYIQGNTEIGYVYPCKLFTLHKSLMQ